MIEISSLDFSLTDAIKEEIHSMEPILAKHFPEDETIHVTLSKTSPTSFKVGMQGHMKGENIVSHHESHNFHKALELCKDHFIKQVEKKKDIQKHNRR